MMENLLIYFSEYEIDNIPRDDRYTDVMASVTSFAPIKMQDEETILTIKYNVILLMSMLLKNLFKIIFMQLLVSMCVNGIKMLSIILEMVLFLLPLIIMLELNLKI